MYMALRFLKFIGMAMFFAGIVGTFAAQTLSERQRWARLHAAPGFVLSWFIGLALVSATGRRLLDTWIVASVVTSLLALFAVLTQSEFRQEKSKTLSIFASLSFVATLALMVYKP